VTSILGHTPFVTSMVELATMWDYPARAILKNAYGPHHPPITHALVEAWTRPLLADNAAAALIGMTRHGIAGFTREQLQAGTPPATVIWGEFDNVDPVASGRQAAADLHAPFVEIKGAGHVSMLGDPVAVAHAIDAASAR
jgi:pimeloyl-ACP methyl ester carboxylesterase